MSDRGPERLLLLGVDYADYGRVHLATQADERTAAAISVGGDYVAMRKGDLPVPNEDTCLAIDHGDCTLLAVCDGHHGHWASHGLAESLAEALADIDELPRDPLALLRLVVSLAQPIPDDATDVPEDLPRSRSTMLVAVVDRAAQRAFGISYGDSSIFIVGPRELPVRANAKDEHYVSPWVPRTLDPRAAREFVLPIEPGDLLVACSDGIDECHYQSPRTSIGVEHLRSLRIEAGGAPEAFTSRLAALALRGVGGHPGGQDNLVVVATRV